MSHCSNNLCSWVALGTKQTARWGSYSWMLQQDSWEWNNAKECVSVHSQQPSKWSVTMLHPTHLSKTVVEGKMEWCWNTNVRPDNTCGVFSNRALQGDKAAHFKAKVEAWLVTTCTEYDKKCRCRWPDVRKRGKSSPVFVHVCKCRRVLPRGVFDHGYSHSNRP